MKKSTERILLAAGSLLAASLLVRRHFLGPVCRPKRATYPYALLLGCPTRKDGSPSRSQRSRCLQAIKSWKAGQYETLIISGGAAANEYAEAKAMADLISQSEPDLPILLETNAKNTWQNLEYAKEIVGDAPILIITSAAHARRAGAMAASFFQEYAMQPADDFRWKHFWREQISQMIYIRLEIEKLRKGDRHES